MERRHTSIDILQTLAESGRLVLFLGLKTTFQVFFVYVPLLNLVFSSARDENVEEK